MKVNRELFAPCGLYCGACGIRYANKHSDEKLRGKLAEFYGMKVDSLKCDGCLSNNRMAFCQSCKIRDCVNARKISGCHVCSEFPCDNIKNFPFKVAIPYMMRATSYRKGKTDEQWVKWEQENWKCKACGTPIFRGARRCPKCKSEITPVTE
ncbi:MAG: DUF3795 domain-containing protein [Candidatus Atabeyarchaeum deiterrae]